MPNLLFEGKQWPVVIVDLIAALFGISFGLAIPYFIDGSVHGVYEAKINISTIVQILATLLVGTVFSLFVVKLNNEFSLKSSNNHAIKDELRAYCMESLKYLEDVNLRLEKYIKAKKEGAGFFKSKSHMIQTSLDAERGVKLMKNELDFFATFILHILERHQAIELDGARVSLSPKKRPENFSMQISSACDKYQRLYEVYWDAITHQPSDSTLLQVMSQDDFASIHIASQDARKAAIEQIYDLKFEINSHIFR